MREWGAGLMAVLPRALDYIESQGRDVDSNKDAWSASFILKFISSLLLSLILLRISTVMSRRNNIGILSVRPSVCHVPVL